MCEILAACAVARPDIALAEISYNSPVYSETYTPKLSGPLSLFSVIFTLLYSFPSVCLSAFSCLCVLLCHCFCLLFMGLAA